MAKDVNWTRNAADSPKTGPVMEIHPANPGGNPLEYLEGEALTAKDAADNGKADGDNPSYAMPPFANGQDLRNRG